ncbi:Dihydropteroate synthase [Laetiporus sulphureus 93-53]|uniref:Dihydropteroate synthase n=1 Tax=Laetiporus sulphureus 93-53 TaxID=1314785 RepID=A0A165F188_9APHY|nr:Dihydropteroate synthase [Laetiporus sulphureus 93-53]KZT08155.1 Dihydropteroate synthase [Laetiporus sulphureus 93-53]
MSLTGSQARHAKSYCTSPSIELKDAIRIKDLTLLVPFTDGAQWPAEESTLQPVRISLTVPHDVRQTATTDDLSSSIDYSALLSSVHHACSSSPANSLEILSDRIFRTCFETHPEVERLCLKVTRPKALLHADAASIESTRTRSGVQELAVRLTIENLECDTIVGVNPAEREQRQRVRFNVALDKNRKANASFSFRELTHKLSEHIAASSYFTLEALASSVARTTLNYVADPEACVTVRAGKPSALALAEAAEVEISRTLFDYPYEFATAVPQSAQGATSSQGSTNLSSLIAALPGQGDTVSSLTHTAAIALGANLGDRFYNVELALRLLEAPCGDLSQTTGKPRAVVVDTSFMYETEPMYVTDQPKFINCACIIKTDMAPLELLGFVKEIENTVGRVTSFRNGPRAIDLDILMHDSLVMDSRVESERGTLDNLAGQLVVPHPRIAEREFVLRPLNDMIPDYIHPVSGKSVQNLLKHLLRRQAPNVDPMHKVMPFPRYPHSAEPGSRPSSPALENIPPVPPTATYWRFPLPSMKPHGERKTYIMGTLNATPDSFSDGSVHNTIPAALAYAISSVVAGADIIDVGGYSTRPRAEYVSPEEELSRVVPVIQAIRGIGQDSKTDAGQGVPEGLSQAMKGAVAEVPISVDTFRADVASAAILEGANCINDVHAFTGPDYPLTSSSAEHFLDMRAVARNLAVPVVLMHSRGEASANKDYSAYDYAADEEGRGAVLEGVRVELCAKVEAAVKGPGGIRRWFVILDPGVGFSKTVEGNLEVLRNAATLTTEYLPSYPRSRRRNTLAGYPQLIGASRKSFLGAILAKSDPNGSYKGRETRPDERGWATAAAVSCAVQQRAAVVRVHDVLELGDVVRICSALWA